VTKTHSRTEERAALEARRGAYILMTGSAAVVLFLGWYLLVLLGRTEFLARGTSIGSDAIVGFHALGLCSATASALAQRHLKLRYGWAIFAAACAVEFSFLLLNLFGKVWEYQKGTPDSLCEAVAHLLREVL